MAYIYVFDFTKYYYNGLPSIHEAKQCITHCTTKGSFLLKRYTYLINITRTLREAKDGHIGG
jgi:hypothetical protein